MQERRGYNRGSFIAGSSVHNQRIERLWRDVYYSVVCVFYQVFYYLESIGRLNPVCETDLFSLHYVYIPRINRALREFETGWNHHPLSSQQGRTPMQLFCSRNLLMQKFQRIACQICKAMGWMFQALAQAQNLLTLLFHHAVNVSIPSHVLHSLDVNPLADSNHYGMDLYATVRSYVCAHQQR